ncbi:hypothetical protein Q4E40_07250 [Pontibacter sp. BT731]|uniref:hypothetical protein n=1 Tax=Pontibacter coccineus TaxID=3063328 RepID=UPI0026E2FA20|nr:hypothetical protein [Pontibacter sp. BT731]MDO6389918.1 hypothetical protein [Pontibacter sp. BT731]
MKNTLFITNLVLLLLLFPCDEREAEQTALTVEKPIMKEDAINEKDVETKNIGQFSSLGSDRNSIVQDSIKILGTWLSEEDKNWKLVFTSDGKCIQHYGDEVISTENYSISNTSPQCGLEFTVDANSTFLQLINVGDESTICYYITGLSDEYLTLSVVGRGGVLAFFKK